MALEALKAYAAEQMQRAGETVNGNSAPTTNADPYSGCQSTQITFEKQNRLQGDLEAIQRERVEHIRQSEQARHRLIKGWTDGEMAEKLLLLAVECISDMTGDTLLLEHFKK